MKRRGRNLESKTDQRHDQTGGQERRDSRELRCDRRETGGAGCSVNETDAEEGERARGAAEEEILHAGFRGPDVALVERRHDIKRKTGELEPDENEQELFAADEQHQADGREKKKCKVFGVMLEFDLARDDHGEKGERQADHFEQGNERRNNQHAVEEVRVGRQHQHGRGGEEKSGSSDSGTDDGHPRAQQSKRKDHQRGDHQGHLGRGETE